MRLCTNHSNEPFKASIVEAIADTIDALKGSLEWFVQLSSYQGLFFMPSCNYPSSSFNTFLN